MMESPYTYFAFISHSSTDEKEVRRLWHAIEWYRIPSKYRIKVGNKKNAWLRPVFWYKYDLTSTDLKAGLMKELDASRNLILLCSPEAARSPYVNDEVKRFIETGKEKQIFPIILRGKPYDEAGSAEECYPPCLIELKEHTNDELRGPNIAKDGRVLAYNNLVAALLGVRGDLLYKRYKWRKALQLFSVFAVLLTAILSYCGYQWHMKSDYTYYENVEDVNGIPNGINLLEHDVQRLRQYSFRFEYKRPSIRQPKRLVTVSRVDSHNYPVQFLDRGLFKVYGVLPTFDFPMMAIRYNKDGVVAGIDFLDVDGNLQESYTYSSSNGKIRNIVDIERINTSSEQPSFKIEERTEIKQIKRLRLTRDRHGRIERVTYHSHNGSINSSKIQDLYGSFGYQIERDSLGRIQKTTALGHDYLPKNGKNGFASVQYGSDFSEYRFYDKDGNAVMNTEGAFHRLVLKQDEYGNFIKEMYFNTENKPCTNSSGYCYAVIKLQNGLVTECGYYGINGEPVAFSLTGAYSKRMEYDKDGQKTKEYYYGADGRAVLNKSGFHLCVYEYDEYHHCSKESYFDENLQPTLNDLGIAVVKIKKDRSGRTLTQESFDTKMKPCICNKGYHKLESLYGVNGSTVIGNVFWGDDLKKIIIKDGYASWKCETGIDDDDNLVQMFKFYDVDGHLTMNKNLGAAVMKRVVDINGNILSEHYFNTNQEPTLNIIGAFEVLYNYNEAGYPIGKRFLDAEGKLTDTILGYAEVRTAYSDDYSVETDYYYLSDQTPAWTLVGAPEVKIENRVDRTVISYYLNEEPVLCQDGYHRVETVSNYNSLTQLTYHYSTDSLPVINNSDSIFCREAVYNSIGLVLESTTYDAGMKPVIARRTTGGPRVIWEYDGRGNKLSQSFWTKDGAPTENAMGIHGMKNEYDKYGRIISYFCINSEGNIVDDIYNQHKVIYQYDSLGRQVRMDNFDDNNELMALPTGPATTLYEYDRIGNITKTAFLDEYGDPINMQGLSSIESLYDKKGNLSEQTFYNADHELLKSIKYERDTDGLITGAHERFMGEQEFDTLPALVTMENDNPRIILRIYNTSILNDNYYLLQKFLDGISIIKNGGMIPMEIRTEADVYSMTDNCIRTESIHPLEIQIQTIEEGFFRELQEEYQ